MSTKDDERLCFEDDVLLMNNPPPYPFGSPDANRYDGLPQQNPSGRIPSRPDVVLSNQHQARAACGTTRTKATPLRPTEVGLRSVEIGGHRLDCARSRA